MAAAHIESMATRKPKHLAPKCSICPSGKAGFYLLALSALNIFAVFLLLPRCFGGPSNFTNAVTSWVRCLLSFAMVWTAVKNRTLYNLTFWDSAGLVANIMTAAVMTGNL